MDTDKECPMYFVDKVSTGNVNNQTAAINQLSWYSVLKTLVHHNVQSNVLPKKKKVQ